MHKNIINNSRKTRCKMDVSGTHMNVGSGESPHNPGLGAPRSSLKRNSIISQEDKIRILKRGIAIGGEGKEGFSLVPFGQRPNRPSDNISHGKAMQRLWWRQKCMYTPDLCSSKRKAKKSGPLQQLWLFLFSLIGLQSHCSNVTKSPKVAEGTDKTLEGFWQSRMWGVCKPVLQKGTEIYLHWHIHSWKHWEQLFHTDLTHCHFGDMGKTHWSWQKSDF